MRYILYLFLFLFVFNVYFYIDIVTNFTVTNGFIRILSKIFKNINFSELFRKFYNFIRSKLKSPSSREYLLKFYNYFIFKFKKR